MLHLIGSNPRKLKGVPRFVNRVGKPLAPCFRSEDRKAKDHAIFGGAMLCWDSIPVSATPLIVHTPFLPALFRSQLNTNSLLMLNLQMGSKTHVYRQLESIPLSLTYRRQRAISQCVISAPAAWERRCHSLSSACLFSSGWQRHVQKRWVVSEQAKLTLRRPYHRVEYGGVGGTPDEPPRLLKDSHNYLETARLIDPRTVSITWL